MNWVDNKELYVQQPAKLFSTVLGHGHSNIGFFQPYFISLWQCLYKDLSLLCYLPQVLPTSQSVDPCMKSSVVLFLQRQFQAPLSLGFSSNTNPNQGLKALQLRFLLRLLLMSLLRSLLRSLSYTLLSTLLNTPLSTLLRCPFLHQSPSIQLPLLQVPLHWLQPLHLLFWNQKCHNVRFVRLFCLQVLTEMSMLMGISVIELFWYIFRYF